MTNPRRGEVDVSLAGRTHTLRLTLAGLAALEDAFAVEDLPALGRRLAEGRLSSRDLGVLLAIGLRGGGTPVSEAEIAEWPITEGLEAWVSAVAAMLATAFRSDGPSARP